ncbi:nucleoporin NUP53 isoform X1 [Acyrthosiphon pisum]|uniref:Nucleoporin NUP53 n=1 Tax=Acyrthosiphon pisum TaxID=7029 RepID=A0A8R2F759_ACYPI|nr:nucleoporin NUP53 isoform X1 [Acyrthosiphon pisum]XP_029344739.1 nucleoporin NUP53 isoform X1 [Acyrthosiphon pisum]XP_029344740.1 nucleoporin NUP53 isoform X1 [Acyrthosiphon pisum]|eukprot:XP_008181412.1 PREDICTED: nucleoporin NUP53 isoform X1 [Acyrthosiphon pisum]
MEPMALGSPSHDSPQKPIYLPGYLMGERAQSPIGNVSISTMSPLRANRSQTPDVHTTFLMRNFHHELSDKPSSTPISNRVNDEPTKAPTIDLFDSINTSDYSEKQCNNKENKQFYSDINNLVEQPKAAPGCWITVFGFSISNKDEILSKFKHMVSCCDVRQAGPNWAHICFSDPTDYHRALLFHGQVTNNGAMIGVIPCNDKTILNENISPIDSHPGPSTDILSKSLRSPILGQQFSSPNDSISKRNNIRPMAIRPIPIQGNNNSPSATTSNGIVTKTLEYLFGW